jgi:hypothetical protein
MISTFGKFESKEPLILSPALSRLFRRHFDHDYYLPHVTGFIHANINKEDSINAIKQRYHKHFEAKAREFANDRQALANSHAWRLKMHDLITDLRALSHNDIDILRHIHPTEAMPRDIKTIKGRPVIYAREETGKIESLREIREKRLAEGLRPEELQMETLDNEDLT